MGGASMSRGFAPSAMRGSPNATFQSHPNNFNNFRQANLDRGRNGDFRRGDRDFRADRDHRGNRDFNRFDRDRRFNNRFFGFGGGWWGPWWGWWGPWGWGNGWYDPWYNDSYAYGGYPGYSSFYSGPTTYNDDDTPQGQPPDNENFTDDSRPRREAPTVNENAALIAVRVPPNAELWFEGKKTTQTGPVREFQTPSLALGQEYTYNVRARWKEGDRDVEQTRKVTLRAGDRLGINFMPPRPKSPEPIP
jgi:uncharacterized protein (TIGR03000 family)